MEMATPSTSSGLAPDAMEEEEALDTLLTRLALTDESKLERVLSKLLPLIIGRLQSPHQTTKKKVLEMLSHINKRVKGQSHIKLPFKELLDLYMDNGTAPIVKNFAIVYLEMALERVSDQERLTVVPSLLDGLSGRPGQHQDMLLLMAIEGLQQYGSERGVMEQGFAERFGFMRKPADRDIFLGFCRQFVIYQPAPVSAEGASITPRGLSLAQLKRVAGKRALNAEELGKRKFAIINVLNALDLSIELLYPTLLIASADSDSRVSRRAEEILKKRGGNVNLENVELIRQLLSMFQGTPANVTCADDVKVAPASVPLKTRLMSVFTRSIAAANQFPATLHVVFDCVYGANTTIKLKQAGMEFAVWIFRQLRAFTYQAVSQLAQRTPHLVSGTTSMATRFFSALKTESPAVKSSVQEGLSALAAAYQTCSADMLANLEGVLLENVQHDRFGSRRPMYTTVNTIGDLSSCTRDVAQRGLEPPKEQSQGVSSPTTGVYPSFPSMVEYVVKQLPRASRPAQFSEALLLPPKTYIALVQFLHRCRDANINSRGGKQSADGMKITGSYDADSMDDGPSSSESYRLILEHALVKEGTSELTCVAAESLLDCASTQAEAFAAAYRRRTDWLKQLLKHIDSSTRTVAAKLLGITIKALTSTEAAALIQELSVSPEAVATLKFEEIHGNFCALGYIIAQCMTGTPSVPTEVLEASLSSLFQNLCNKDRTIGAACAEAFGSMGLRGPLPLPLGIVDNKGKGKQEDSPGEAVGNQEGGTSGANADDSSIDPTRAAVIKRIANLLESKEVRVVTKAVEALGRIGYCDNTESILRLILDNLFTLSKSQGEDVLSTVGEALTFIWGGIPISPEAILQNNFTSLAASADLLLITLEGSSSDMEIAEGMDKDASVKDGSHEESPAHGAKDLITKKLFDELLFSSRKDEKLAGTIWLLSLVTYVGRDPKIQSMLPDIQEAFLHALGERNEVTLDFASKGMSIVYQLGGARMRERLVESLVASLSGVSKKRRTVKRTGDSESQEDSSSLDTPGGGFLSTYKELCTITSELGQPELLYKFVAVLTSRRGGSPGFAMIAKRACTELQPHVSPLVPKLYRYQYDPNKSIQVRSYLEQIWTLAIRALDDLKETVRNAAGVLCRTLKSLTVRLCDRSLTPELDVEQCLEIILPFLMNKGIVNDATAVRALAVDTLTKITKGAGPKIRAQMPELVACMLESLSSLEDSRLNYVEMHAERLNMSTEKLQAARISVAKESPMWETLSYCVRQIDGTLLAELVPKLTQIVRSGVGLNTRAGVAKFISMICDKVAADIRPHSGALLKTLFMAMQKEKSTTVSRAFAAALASVAKHATDARFSKLVEDSIALYTTPGDAESRSVSAGIIRELSRQAADALRGYHTDVLPTAFFARFDEEKDVKAMYTEVWEESSRGSNATLQLYLQEIVKTLRDGLATSHWPRKQQVLKAFKNQDLFHHVDMLLLDALSNATSKDSSTQSSLLATTSDSTREDRSTSGPPLIPVINCLASAWESAGEETLASRGKDVAKVIGDVRSAALEFLREALQATNHGESLSAESISAVRARVDIIASSDRDLPTKSIAESIRREHLALRSRMTTTSPRRDHHGSDPMDI
ncbi:hypothetical protein CBR_g37490 [Chara braunii]|uniref:TOG domain-containing protein n=1 Tax=Chara braunii TaxID=69332 RepID=A0A388LN44_CHABU|nr:hypothetical protein CBR_g37490 [Chara braunii]|eukprot:GBG83689.1 hypothetical protein CBR_g37490 [Chara braunii]